MSRGSSRRWPTTRELVEEIVVEYRATNYLAKLPQPIAVVTSVRVAMQLAELWEIEKVAMNRRGDHRPVYHVADEERRWLASAATVSSQSPFWGLCPHEYVGKLFADLPADVAAYLAFRVALWVGERLQ